MRISLFLILVSTLAFGQDNVRYYSGSAHLSDAQGKKLKEYSFIARDEIGQGVHKSLLSATISGKFFQVVRELKIESAKSGSIRDSDPKGGDSTFESKVEILQLAGHDITYRGTLKTAERSQNVAFKRTADKRISNIFHYDPQGKLLLKQQTTALAISASDYEKQLKLYKAKKP